jgi:PAS domain S-box-containing protein
LLDRALAHAGPIEDFEIEFQPPGRAPIYGLMHLLRWRQDPNRPLQFQGVIKDISPHKRLEQELRASQDKYKTLYDLASISSSSLKLEDVVERSLELIHECCRCSATLLLMNRTYEELNYIAGRGLNAEQLAQLERHPPVIGQDLLGRLAITAAIHEVELPDEAGLHPVVRELMQAHPEGALTVVALGRGNPTLPTSLLLLIAPSEACGLDTVLVNGLTKTLEMGITNCFHYANSQETETRYRELWDHAPAYFISLLKGGIIFEVNHTAAQALGCSLQDLIGHPFTQVVDPRDHELFLHHHGLVIEQGEAQVYELHLRNREGQRIIVAVKSEPLLDRNGVIVGEKAVLHDVTLGKELEARLRDYADNLERKVGERTLELTQTMNFLNGILEGSTEYAIVGLDEKGKFLHFNRGAQLLFGHDSQHVVGHKGLEILIDFEHGPWGSLEDLLGAVDRQGVLVQEAPLTTADNRSLTGLLTINRLRTPAFNNLTYVAIMRDITEQKELEELLKLYTENLQQVIEQKSRELDRQHIQLIQSSKLATLGEMAAGIAHELNQPLSGIRTRAQLVTKALERNQTNPARIQQNQEEIIQLVDRITRIIHHMRIFARQDQQRFTPFNLNQSIEGALSLLGEQLRIHAIKVVKRVPAGLPLVLGEPLQIEQVLLNLLSNARDAIDARAEQIRQEQGEEETTHYQKQLELTLYPANDSELCLEIRDNGAGMNEETQQKIFEPFFTTKPVGRGTGLGLSISYGILSNHNGRCEVESKVGVGSIFRVYLPTWTGESEQAAAVPDTQHAPSPEA